MPTPVAATERVALLDMLRGFALLGILLVNFEGEPGTRWPTLDRAIVKALDIGVDSSFYPLFSLLFGVGLAVQWQRVTMRDGRVALFFLRRLLALFLIGSAHAIIIWRRDILFDYAVLGLLVIPLHRLRDRWLLPIAMLPLILGLFRQPLEKYVSGRSASAESVLQLNLARADATRLAAALEERSVIDGPPARATAFVEAVHDRWRFYRDEVRNKLSLGVRILFSDIAALILLGYVLGRRRILQEASRHRGLLVTGAVAGLLSAVAAALFLHGVAGPSPVAKAFARVASDYGATVFYICLIAFVVTFSRSGAKLFHPFAAAGRLGLTNYLLQSVVMTLLFSAYGARLTAPSTTVWLMIDLLFFFAVQLPLSAWWVQRFRYGPAEWVWRSMTYGTRQPMRLPARAASSATFDLQPAT